MFKMCRSGRILIAALLAIGFLTTGLPQAAANPVARVPRFSHTSGFYQQEFSLVLTPPAPGGVIYYTLDGSEPDQHARVYKEPIPIVFAPDHDGDIAYIETTMERVPGYMQWLPPRAEPFKATVVRARYVIGGAEPSPVVTETFFTAPDIRSRFTLPVLAIATDPGGLFSDEEGIYVPGKIYADNNSDRWSYGQHPANYNQRGVEWERTAHLTWVDPRGTVGFAHEIGLRIHGAWSRVQPMKSLRIYSRTVYGEGSITYAFFAEGEARTYERLLLRNGGQDFYHAFMRDVLGQSLVSHLGLDVQEARPVVVFINGVYWGIHYVRERYDERYIEKYYTVPRDQVVLIENNGGLLAGLPEDRLLWYRLRDYLFEHSLVDDGHYQEVVSQIDLENYLDYLTVSIYSANQDWPGNNVRFWRIREPIQTGTVIEQADGRWRWLINDLDSGFREADYDMYELLARESTAWPTPAWSTIMFRRLMENPDFRVRYLNRLDYHLHTTFSPEHALAWIAHWEGLISLEMPRHIQRWRRPGSMEAWEASVDVLRRFVQMRPDFLRSQTEAFFGLDASCILTLRTDAMYGNSVRLNGIPVNGTEPWSGLFFAGQPVHLEAEPQFGYRFSGWELADGEQLAESAVIMSDDLALRPVFIRFFWAEPVFLLLFGVLVSGLLALWIRSLLRRRQERAHEQLLYWDRDQLEEQVD